MILALAGWMLATATPQGEPVKWGKNGSGYALSPQAPVQVQVTDSKALLVIVRGAKTQKITVTLLRDDRFASENHLNLKAMAFGPPDKPVGAMISLAPPAGAHSYSVSSDTDGLLLTVIEVPKATGTRAAVEKEVKPAEAAKPVAAVAPASQPAEATATPTTPSETSGAPRIRIKPLRIAVYDLELQNVPTNIGVVVTGSILTETRKLQRVSAIGMNEVRDMLSHEATKQLLGCKESDSCLADIAGAVGVDNLVTGKLTRVEGTSVMVLRRIDQARAEVKGTVERRLKTGSGEEFLAAVGSAVADLFPEYPIREGLRRGVDKEVGLRLNPPPLPVWAFGTVAGLAGASAITGGIFGFLANSALADYKSYAQLGTSQVISGATLVHKGNTAQQRATIANALFITSGGLVVVAAVMALFTDWHGFRDVAAHAQPVD